MKRLLVSLALVLISTPVQASPYYRQCIWNHNHKEIIDTGCMIVIDRDMMKVKLMDTDMIKRFIHITTTDNGITKLVDTEGQHWYGRRDGDEYVMYRVTGDIKFSIFTPDETTYRNVSPTI